ncbi:MAG: mannose-1-phosphate guanylyltransferase/mannose-6-phosphate isomerase [Actinomycetota bacterium]
MKNKSNIVYPVILAGGSGTRLWPLSRELTPKQLIALGGEDSLLQQTIDRAYLLSENTPIIVTNKKIHDQVDFTKLPKTVEFLLEPSPKNTAPAIALAVRRALELDPESVVVILSADHHIDDEKFVPFVEHAIEAAVDTNRIVLIGIKPIRPETGYGYIKIGKKIDGAAFEISDFVEKPNKKKAETYLADEKYLWNAGIFIAKAKVLKAEFDKHLPELKDLFSDKPSESVFENIEPFSIDTGLLEKTKNIAVVPASAAWNDLGSWGSIYDISKMDINDNYLEGNVITKDTTGSLIMSRGNRRIATIGLKDVVIVDTEDVTLICDRDQSQNVKHIVEQVKLEPNNKDYIVHKTMQRPWGRFTILDEANGFKVKFIHVNPKSKISLQSHVHRDEHWVVVKGEARITHEDEVKTFGPNDGLIIPAGTKHRLENMGDTELTVVEVAIGDYIEEDDIQRFDDIYLRG